MARDIENETTWMTVKQLKKCLTDLRDNDFLVPNQTGSLSVFRDSEKKLIGYIDFGNERFEKL